MWVKGSRTRGARAKAVEDLLGVFMEPPGACMARVVYGGRGRNKVRVAVHVVSCRAGLRIDHGRMTGVGSYLISALSVLVCFCIVFLS